MKDRRKSGDSGKRRKSVLLNRQAFATNQAFRRKNRLSGEVSPYLLGTNELSPYNSGDISGQSPSDSYNMESPRNDKRRKVKTVVKSGVNSGRKNNQRQSSPKL